MVLFSKLSMKTKIITPLSTLAIILILLKKFKKSKFNINEYVKNK